MSGNAQGKDRLAPGEAFRLETLVDCVEGSVVSRTLVKSAAGTITVFAFDEGQGLSEHTAPFDAFVQVIDGEVEFTIGGTSVHGSSGDVVLMPADVPHSVHAPEKCKMMLVMIRG